MALNNSIPRPTNIMIKLNIMDYNRLMNVRSCK